jgi:hypothetical protein
MARVIRAMKKYTIDTSGGPPTADFGPDAAAAQGAMGVQLGDEGKPGTSGRPGSNGLAAGNILLCAAQFEMTGGLNLLANGGAGGAGESGGRGGDGHRGEDGINSETMRSVADVINKNLPEAGKPGGRGGHGGDAGKGGDGGDGGSITVRYVISRDQSQIAMKADAGAPGQPGKPGAGGGGGAGGAGGSFNTLSSQMGQGMRTTKVNALGGSNGATGDAGRSADSSHPGNPGQLGDKNCKAPTSATYDIFRGDWSVKKIEAKKVNYYKPRIGWPDKIKLPARTIGVIDGYTPFPLSAGKLALHKARMHALTAGRDGIGEVVAILTWLLQVAPGAAWYAALRSAVVDAPDAFDQFCAKEPHWAEAVSINPGLDKEYEGYTRQLNDFLKFRDVMEQKSTEWIAFANTITVQFTRITQGLDYFGHPWNWTPLVPLGEYMKEGKRLIENARRLEDVYKEYTKVVKKQQEAQATFNNAVQAGQAGKAEAGNALEKLIADRAIINSDLGTLQKAVLEQEQKLADEAKEFVEVLRKELDAESVAKLFDLIKNGVSLVADVAKIVMAPELSAALGTLSTEAAALEKIKKDGYEADDEDNGAGKKEKKGKDDKKGKGDKKEKDKKDKEVDLGKLFGSLTDIWKKGVTVVDNFNDLNDLGKQYQEAAKKYGFGNALLVMSREEFDEKLESVYKKVPKDAEKYKKIFSDYKSMVESYQRKYQELLVSFINEVSIGTDIIGMEAEITSLAQKMRDSADPGLPEFRTYIYGLYNGAKIMLLDFIYQEYQALRYAALSDDALVLRGDTTVAELENAHTTAYNQMLSALNDRDTPVQKFKRLTIELRRESFPEQFAKLEAGEKAVFALSWSNPVVREQLGAYAAITVEQCRVHLPLARAKKGQVHVEISHAGAATIIDSHGRMRDFQHQPTKIYYEYKVEVSKSRKEEEETGDDDYVFNHGTEKSFKRMVIEHMSPVTGGYIGGSDEHDRQRIMISPLAVWTIEVPKKINDAPVNKGVDCSKIEQIFIHFAGRNQAWAVKSARRLKAGSPVAGAPAVSDDPSWKDKAEEAKVMMGGRGDHWVVL